MFQQVSERSLIVHSLIVCGGGTSYYYVRNSKKDHFHLISSLRLKYSNNKKRCLNYYNRKQERMSRDKHAKAVSKLL